MSAVFAYPTDDPAQLELRRKALHDSATEMAGLGRSLAAARRTALAGWSGPASLAASSSLAARVGKVDDDAESLARSASAVDAYRTVVMQMRSEIDRLRAQRLEIVAAQAETDEAARSFVRSPTADGVAGFLTALARQAALRRVAGNLQVQYEEAMRRVAEAAATCASVLWERGAGAAARARDEAEREGSRRRVPPGVRAPGETPEPGGSTYEGGLGPMVPGTSVSTPEPPPWPAPDPGAGEYASEFAWPDDHLTHAAASAGVVAARGKWPHATENLSHFLGNSGQAREQDVDQMLTDLPMLGDEVETARRQLGSRAVAEARAEGATGPVTLPVSTGWTGYYARSSESQDWYYATGGFMHSQQGQVTVYPPTSQGASGATKSPQWSVPTIGTTGTAERRLRSDR